MDISLDDYYEQIESETLSDSYNHFLNKIEPIYQGNDLLTLKAIAKEETSKNNEEFINLIKTASLISFIKKIDSNYLVEDMIVKKNKPIFNERRILEFIRTGHFKKLFNYFDLSND